MSGDTTEEERKELQELREQVTFLTNQCVQLDTANQAWQQYQQSQMDNFRSTFQTYLPIDENLSFDQTIQQVFDQITKEREDFNDRCQALEKINEDLRQGNQYTNILFHRISLGFQNRSPI